MNHTMESLRGKYKRIAMKHHKEGEAKGTIAALVTKEGKIHVGIARCHSTKDAFNRRVGRQIALGRALLAEQRDAEKGTPRVNLDPRTSYTIDANEVAMQDKSDLETATKKLLGENVFLDSSLPQSDMTGCEQSGGCVPPKQEGSCCGNGGCCKKG